MWVTSKFRARTSGSYEKPRVRTTQNGGFRVTYRDEGLEIFVTLSDTLMREKQEDEKRPHGVVGGWKGVARRTSHSCSKIKKKDRRGEKSPESLKLKNKINGSASGRASIYRTFGANFGWTHLGGT